jgi:hypothetical protein
VKWLQLSAVRGASTTATYSFLAVGGFLFAPGLHPVLIDY